jgi:hypothetical protein
MAAKIRLGLIGASDTATPVSIARRLIGLACPTASK